MEIFRKIVYIYLALLLTTPSAQATEAELCAPFKETADKSLISSMLQAAKFDQLFRIKEKSSKMGFCVQSSVGLVKGDFKNFEGGIALTGAKSQTMVSIDVGSLETNMIFINPLLKGDTFLDVENHPKLVFISSGFHWISPEKAVLKGNLTMRGITKEVAFYINIVNVEGEPGDAGSILVKASTTVLRSEFGMNSMSPLISDKVNLCMSVEAERYINI